MKSAAVDASARKVQSFESDSAMSSKSSTSTTAPHRSQRQRGESQQSLHGVGRKVCDSLDMSISHPKTRTAVAEAGSLAHKVAHIQKDLEAKRASASANPADRASELLEAARTKARSELGVG